MSTLAQTSATLKMFTGPMFSGKTTNMLLEVYRAAVLGTCVVIKFTGDDRYGSSATIVGHNGIKGAGPRLTSYIVRKLGDIDEAKAFEGVTLIAIDEGQFFEDLVPSVLRYVFKLGIPVLVAALDRDYTGRPFENVALLEPYASFIVHCTSVCTECGGVATFTRRTCTSSERLLVGGAEMYVPCCVRCFLKHSDTEHPLRVRLRVL